MMLVICLLAVWRATVLIVEDEGPFSIFSWIRDHVDPHQRTWVGRGINCPYCVSFWTGLVASIWLWYFGLIPAFMVPIWWFGLSGGTVGFTMIGSALFTRRKH